jgi:hypothetical protein
VAVRPRVAQLHRRLARAVERRADVTRTGVGAVPRQLAGRALHLAGRTRLVGIARWLQDRAAADRRPCPPREQGQRRPGPPWHAQAVSISHACTEAPRSWPRTRARHENLMRRRPGCRGLPAPSLTGQ